MMVTIPLDVVFRNLTVTIICVSIFAAITVLLKVFWYDRLEKGCSYRQHGQKQRNDGSVRLLKNTAARIFVQKIKKIALPPS